MKIQRLVLLVFYLLMIGGLSYGQSDKTKPEFKLEDRPESRYLVLKDLARINNSPDNAAQPGLVWIKVPFPFDAQKIDWLREKGQAGSPAFFDSVVVVMRTWNYVSDIPVSGYLLYKISTDGKIEIFTENLNVDLNSAAFAKPRFWIKHKGFPEQKIILNQSPEQRMVSAQKNWMTEQIEKLSWVYFIIFLIIIVLGLFFIVSTMYSLFKKINIPRKISTAYEALWPLTILKIHTPQNISRALKIDNPSPEDELRFLLDVISTLKTRETEPEVGKVLDDSGEDEIVSCFNQIPYATISDQLEKLYQVVMKDGKKNDPMIVLDLADKRIKTHYSEVILKCLIKSCEKYEAEGFHEAKIFLAGLQAHLRNVNTWYASSEIDRAIDKMAVQEMGKIKGHLDGIWIVASIAPMLGLFGTVTGISSAFAEISKVSGGMTQGELITRLAGGIFEALYTTIWGLVIGIATTILYYIFKFLMDTISNTWEKKFANITNNF